jgi:hypothetical protein
MAFKYYGTSGFVKTGEAITVLPSSLIQKKVTVVRRSVNKESLVLTQSDADKQLGDGFFAYPLPSANKQNDGFVQFDIVGYKKGTGRINYKYRKLSSFIVEDQYNPTSQDVAVEVGVSSTIVLSDGTQVETTNENGDVVKETKYESPRAFEGELFAYDLGGGQYVPVKKTEDYYYSDPDILVRTDVAYMPVVVIESVSATYYGMFTEYITTSAVKISKQVLRETTIILEQSS